MARVANVEIPKHKRGAISLTSIFGIGRKTSENILKEKGIDPDKKVVDWTEEELKKVREKITNDYMVEGELKRKLRNELDRLKYIGCLRGIRLRNGLPVRGQNTKNNARTRKGVKKTVAGKKK
ncbi:MAG: 30S ribosomal protein S13 [Bacteroidota bacterium]